MILVRILYIYIKDISSYSLSSYSIDISTYLLDTIIPNVTIRIFYYTRKIFN